MGLTILVYTVLHCPVITIIVRSESFNEEYKSCVAGGGKVVSHAFCLPNSYRKDFPENKTKYFRLRLSDEFVTERHETDLSLT